MAQFESGNQNSPQNWVPRKPRREHRQQDPVILRSPREMNWKNPARRKKLPQNREEADYDQESSGSENGEHHERGVYASSKEIRRDQRHQERMEKHKRFRQSENFSQVDADEGRHRPPNMEVRSGQSSNRSPNDYQPNRSIQSTENWQTSIRTENDFKPNFSVQRTVSTGQASLNGPYMQTKSRKTDNSIGYFSDSSYSSRGSSSHRSAGSGASPRKVRFSKDMSSAPLSSRRSSCNSATQTVISQVSSAFDQPSPIIGQKSSDKHKQTIYVKETRNDQYESPNSEHVYESIDDQMKRRCEVNSKYGRQSYQNSLDRGTSYRNLIDSPLLSRLRTRRSPCFCGPGCRRRSPYFIPRWRRHISSPFCVNLSPRHLPCCYSSSVSSRSIYENMRTRTSPLCHVYGSGFLGGFYRSRSCSPLSCSRSLSPYLSRSPILKKSTANETNGQSSKDTQNNCPHTTEGLTHQNLVKVPGDSPNCNPGGESGSDDNSSENYEHSVQSLDILGYKSPLPDFESNNNLESQVQDDEMESRGSSRHSELVNFEDLKNNREDMKNLTTEYRSQFTHKLPPKNNGRNYSPDSIDDDNDDTENRNDFWKGKSDQLCQRHGKATSANFDHGNCYPEPPFKVDSYTPRRWGPPREDGSPLNPECPFRATSRTTSPDGLMNQSPANQRDIGTNSAPIGTIPWNCDNMSTCNSSRDGPEIAVIASSENPSTKSSSRFNDQVTITVDNQTSPNPEVLSRIDTFCDVESSHISNKDRLTDRRGDRSAADFFSQAATQYTTADDDTCFYYYDNSHAETEDNEPQGFPRDAKGKTDSVTTAAGSFPTESNKSRPNYYVENKEEDVPQQLTSVTSQPATEPRIVVELKLCTCASNCTCRKDNDVTQSYQQQQPEQFTTAIEQNRQDLNADPEWKQSCGVKQSTWKPPTSQREKIELFTLKRNQQAQSPSNGDWIPASQANTGFGHGEPPFFGYRRTVTPKIKHAKRTLA
ncbi:uncharacterized protein LOC142338398 isoform X2 [Convolutriloba macropyga]|uniref:uncharacterized protein LOC142338398 isoform X2 n=1 Tax=Convolutriloba macropyga TaxID=536237 RepID=UPI003F522A05